MYTQSASTSGRGHSSTATLDVPDDTQMDGIQATSSGQPVAPTQMEDPQKDNIQAPSSSEPAAPTELENTETDSIQALSSSEPMAPIEMESTQNDSVQAPSSSEPTAPTEIANTQNDSIQATSSSEPAVPTQIEDTQEDGIQATNSGQPVAPTQIENTQMDGIQATSSGQPIAPSSSVAGGTANPLPPRQVSASPDDSSQSPAAPVRSAQKSAAPSVARAGGKKKATSRVTQSPASENRPRSQTPSVDIDGSRLSDRGTPDSMASVPKPKRNIVDLSANERPAKRAKTDAAPGPLGNTVCPTYVFRGFPTQKLTFQLCNLCGGTAATLMTCADSGCNIQVCVGYPSRECFTRIDEGPLAQTEWYCQEHQQHKLINVRRLPQNCGKLLIRITVPMQQRTQSRHVHEV